MAQVEFKYEVASQGRLQVGACCPVRPNDLIAPALLGASVGSNGAGAGCRRRRLQAINGHLAQEFEHLFLNGDWSHLDCSREHLQNAFGFRLRDDRLPKLCSRIHDNNVCAACGARSARISATALTLSRNKADTIMLGMDGTLSLTDQLSRHEYNSFLMPS